MTCVITGATGEIGSRVAELLLHRGQRPRLFVRDAAKARSRFGDRVDLAVGDLADAASLRAALRPADALFLVNSGPEIPARDQAAAEAAKSAGVGLLVKLSSLDAQQAVGTGVWHAQGEAAIRASGVPFTFVQPTGFMSNARWWSASIKSEGVVRSATGDGKIPFIHSADIAAVAVEALTSQKFVGEALPITGPRALSYAEMGALIAAAIGQPVKFQPIPEEQVRREMVEAGDSPEIVAAHLSIYRAIRAGHLAAVTDGIFRVLARQPVSFDCWVQENREVFCS